MPRRSHRKSRLGCSECKRRHVKCDETRPKCVNCTTAGIDCPFEAQSPSHTTTSRTVSRGATPSPASKRHEATNVQAIEIDRTLGSGLDDAESLKPVNMVHMELLLHWKSDTYRSFAISGEQLEVYNQTSIKYALMFPFLMHTILGMSALHLSVKRPEKSSFYRLYANHLQSQALTGFNKVISNINAESIVPAFLFASLTGLHSFCEAFVHRRCNFGEVLDSLISCINLLRGVRAVIGGWWETLRNSELRPILTTAHDMHMAEAEDTDHLIPLRDLIRTADISASSASTYTKAIDELQTVFNVQSRLTEEERKLTANMVFSWLVIVEPDYIEMLSQRRPEALIILAYYAAILHYRREFWAIGDAGEYLISSISQHLGKHWESWLSWPNAMVAGSVLEIL